MEGMPLPLPPTQCYPLYSLYIPLSLYPSIPLSLYPSIPSIASIAHRPASPHTMQFSKP